MRRLRTKLFLSVGSIFLIIAILSYLVPAVFIEKDINTTSTHLTHTYNMLLKKIRYLSNSWVIYRFVQIAAQLDAVAELIQLQQGNLWEMAAAIFNQDPALAVVQITDSSNNTAVISAESGQIYVPLWAKDEQGTLWIKIPEKNKILRAAPIKSAKTNGSSYLLFADDNIPQLDFTPFEQDTPPQAQKPSPNQLYAQLDWQENRLLEKVGMIQQMAAMVGDVAGALHADASFKKAIALLAEEIFSNSPIVQVDSVTKKPDVIYRKSGSFVDLVQLMPRKVTTDPFVVIGFSLSSIAQDIARAVEKPVLLFKNGVLLQGFSAKGAAIDTNHLVVSPNTVIWGGEDYISSTVQIGPLAFSILIPEAEKRAIFNFLNQIKNSLTTKISVNLLTVAFVLFLVALILLARISKRITKPIAQLAQASEEIGEGKYDDLALPATEKRRDEIATLTHAFEKMVISLRDREKIRGVLNKVVSKEIAAQILNSSIELGGEERILTMLFSDIRDFTPLSETLPPQQLVGLLNAFMTRMCRIIDEKHGVVDKFVGDEIMALYGAPVDLENHAEKAIESAILMVEDLKLWNKERGPEAPQIEIGIGIHTGEALAGNMGASDRLNYTVVGANVNLASRLCSVAKPMQILISEATYLSLANTNKFNFEKLAPVTLKGIDTPVVVYALQPPFALEVDKRADD